MNDLTQLERFTDNFIVDELTWHLSNRGIPLSIEHDCSSIESPKVVFRFKEDKTWSHEIEAGFFVDHWIDAARVLTDFTSIPQLPILPEELIQEFQPYREKYRSAIRKWKADTKQTSEPGS